jgi:AraC-like DNA-binding protein
MEHTYLEVRPSPRLAPYVECYWTRGATEDDLDHRVLPDGCADLLFSRQRDEPLGLWVVGSMSRYRDVPIAAGQSFLGVRFRPAMASCFLPEPMPDKVLPLELLWGSSARRLYDQLGSSRSIEQSIRVLEAHFQTTPAISAIQTAIDYMVRRKGRVSIDDLAEGAGLSSRQFRRQCLILSGLTPKRLCRVIRFRHAVSQIRSRHSWADFAQECGYYDQAHMINEFRELGGSTPCDRFFQYSRQA